MVDTTIITNSLNGTNNALFGVLILSNRATAGLLVYALLLLIFIFLTYYQIRLTQDIEKSLAVSGFIILLLTTVLYYAGKKYYFPVVGVDLISNFIMLAIITLFIIGLGLVYWNRIE